MSKPPKLNESQHNMMLAVGFGAVTHYGPSGYGADTFNIFGSYHRGPIATIVPKVAAPTQTGRALLRVGWIKAFDGALGGHRDAELTEPGRSIFEALLTDEMRAVMAQQAVYDERERKREETRKRKEAWLRQNEETIRTLREAMNERSNRRHHLEHEMKALALQIGRGANDVDGLAARLREIVKEMDDLVRQDEEAKAIWPKFPEDEA